MALGAGRTHFLRIVFDYAGVLMALGDRHRRAHFWPVISHRLPAAGAELTRNYSLQCRNKLNQPVAGRGRPSTVQMADPFSAQA
jgi:hypothetical protein